MRRSDGFQMGDGEPVISEVSSGLSRCFEGSFKGSGERDESSRRRRTWPGKDCGRNPAACVRSRHRGAVAEADVELRVIAATVPDYMRAAGSLTRS